MPLLINMDIGPETKLGVWDIMEEEDFFRSKAVVQREISHPQKRLQHLAGRFLLKELFPDFPFEEIAIAPTKKPFLPDEAFHFSISHSRGKAAVCVSRQYRVGVDVEKISTKTVKLKEKFLDAAAMKGFAAWMGTAEALHTGLDPETLCCTIVWSAKEAVFKWYGLGKVDFREHIHIMDILFEGTYLTIQAVFMLPERRELMLNGLILKEDVVVFCHTS